MTEEAREIQRAYVRSWRAANKDKVRQYNRRYRAKAKAPHYCQPL